MSLPVIFGILALIFLWYNLFISSQIMNYLRQKDLNVSLFNGVIFVRGKIFKYLPLYKETSLKHEGRIGSLYNKFYLSFAGVLLFFLLGIAALL